MKLQTNNKKRQITKNGNGKPEPIVGDRGAYIMGPRNVPIERQNPDALIAPATDAGTVPNFKWPFALSHNRVLTGGWARETTTRELPIAIGHTRYMFAGKVPPSLSEDAPPPPVKQSRQSYTWHMMAQEPTKAPGGSVRITDSRNFTVSKTIAAARIEVEPGAIRELH